MPARFQEEWGGEIAVSVLPRRWRCGQSSNPHARKRRQRLARLGRLAGRGNATAGEAQLSSETQLSSGSRLR